MDLARFYRPRRGDERKGDFGTVLIAGGSDRYSGAPAFNALAALRSGADLAIVVAPRRAADIVASYSPDLITVPCDAPFPVPEVVLSFADRADVLVLGGGIDRSPHAHGAIRQLIQQWPKPMVLDAEAMHVAKPELVRGKRALLTPHGGEFQVLTGKPWPAERAAKEAACRDAARQFGCAILVKGHEDVCSDGQQVLVDPNGSPFMTKGGYGDMLAGVAGTLLARGAAPLEAGIGAAMIVGHAGSIAAATEREALLASDALAQIGRVLPLPGQEM